MSPGQIRQSFPITVWHLKLQVTPGDLKKKNSPFDLWANHSIYMGLES